MTLRSLFSPVVAFLRKAIDALGKLDGKPGLSAEDVRVGLQWVVGVQARLSDVPGSQRHEAVTARLIATGKVPEWAAPIITFLLYQLAQRMGLMPR